MRVLILEIYGRFVLKCTTVQWPNEFGVTHHSLGLWIAVVDGVGQCAAVAH